MDIERRLKDHLAESGNRIRIESEDPVALMNAEPPRSGKVIQVMTAVLLVAMAGGGFWLLSDEKDGVTEIAAGEAEDATDTEDDAQSDQPGNGPTVVTKLDLEFNNITSDLSPSGNGQVVVDNDMYYLLSTAPGRVKFDWGDAPDEEIFKLMRLNSFYVYSEASGWKVSTVEDRFISDFDVRDGVLYVVSTGGVDSDKAAVGTSTDQGESWEWQVTDNILDADQISIMATDDQPLVFASRWGYADHDEAIELAATAGIELTPMTLYGLDGNGFSYVPVDDETRCDFVLGQFLPAIVEMDEIRNELGDEMSDEEFERMRDEQLGWITEEVKANGCSLPENLDDLTMNDVPEMPNPVSKTWEGLGITPPESWNPWAGMYRFDGENLQSLDLPFGPDVQAAYATTDDQKLSISVVPQQSFETEETFVEPEGETVFVTSNGEDWTEEFRAYPQGEEDLDAAWLYRGTDYRPPIIGDRAFRLGWEEEEVNVDEDGAWGEPVTNLEQKVGDGDWEIVSVPDLLGDISVGDRMLQEVRGSSLGVFMLFGPRWDNETGEPTEDSQIAVYSSNGVDWESIELNGQHIHYVNGDNQLLLFSTDWDHEDGQYSVTESYLVRPKQ